MKTSLAYSEAGREVFKQTVSDLERKMKDKVVIEKDEKMHATEDSKRISILLTQSFSRTAP